MKKITIIDYGVGNLLSLKMALEHLGAEAVITRDKKAITNSSHLILPGVGAYGKAMKLIKKYKIDEYLSESKLKGANILGICLGMQLFMSSSFEFGFTKGLNFIEGDVNSISKLKNYKEEIKIPNIGWFKVKKNNDASANSMLEKILPSDTFYFVHSFICEPRNPRSLSFFSDYEGLKITAIIAHDNVIGCQFHPEKSGNSGLKFLDNFIKL